MSKFESAIVSGICCRSHLSGGVSRNVAECMQRLGVKPFIISVVGEDMAGMVPYCLVIYLVTCRFIRDVLWILSVLSCAGKTLLENCKSLGLSIDGKFKLTLILNLLSCVKFTNWYAFGRGCISTSIAASFLYLFVYYISYLRSWELNPRVF